MKIAIPLLLAIAVLAFGGLYFWQQQQIAGAQADSDAFQQIADDRALVPVTFVVTPPAGSTPKNQTVYISGSHPAIGSWDAAGLPLERQDDGTYRGSCDMLTGIEQTFKITRGSWSTVERTADDQDVPDRTFTVEPGKELALTVAAWVDHGQTEPGRITTTGNITVHERRFVSTVDATKPRSVVVYLPPDYHSTENADRHFPVLYVNDGQNIFNQATTFAGVEWGLDETAQQKIATGQIPPIIIVGLYNTEDRDAEYGPGVAAYATHVVEKIMPFIADNYRVSGKREDTTLAGAALGGRAALEVARLQPDAFGTVIALSPWVVDDQSRSITDNWAAADQPTADWAKRTRFYLDTAAATEHYPTDTPTEDLNQIVTFLANHSPQITHHIVADGEHREASWGQRAANSLAWLFAPATP